MATDGRPPAIIETSVLVNFLAVDRTDLLANHPSYRFLVVDLVRNEVIKRTSLARFQAALDAGHLLADGPPETISMEELAAYAAISRFDALGPGERAASAAAHVRGMPLFMDDKRAWKRVDAEFPGIAREGTVSLVVSLIKAGLIDVAHADAIKADWETYHTFRLKFASFAEVV